jgi:TIR domain-containing protein
MNERWLDGPHWLKYVRWDVISRWRGQATAAATEGRLRYPYAFASADNALPGINGGVLWLISSPRYGIYRQPPSIVARLQITDVVARDDPKAVDVDNEIRAFGPWIAIAAEDVDAYLPLNNVSQTLQRLRFQGRVERLPDAPSDVEKPYSHIPWHFQRHRVIARNSVNHLERFAQAVRMGRRVFVSYRRKDFNDSSWVDELATALPGHDVSCWLDIRDVPQNVEKPYECELLSGILGDAIRQSCWFVALMRRGYLEDAETWTRREWTRAGQANSERRRDRMNRVAVLFGEQPDASDWIDPGRDTVINVAPDASASEVVQHLLELLPASGRHWTSSS